MSTVVILGAGASRAQAGSLRKTRTRMHPPLDGDFFSCAERASTEPAVAQRLAAFNQAVAASPRFTSPLHPEVPMEQFFADVYYEVARSRGDDLEFAVYVALMRLYAQVLTTTTNWMAGNLRRGALDRFLAREIAESDGPMTIVTFNQDLLIENSLRRVLRRHPWCLDHIYGGIQLGTAQMPGPATELFRLHIDGTCRHPLPVALLKLHGSLNWSIQMPTQNPLRGTVFPGSLTRAKVWLTHGFNVSLDLQIRLNTRQGRKNWWLWPLLVPPIYDKQRIIAMAALQTTWEAARDALTTADRLVLFGYSIPEADVQARQMLRRALAANPDLEAIDCINPDAGMAAKLKSAFGTKVVRSYADVDSYLRHVE